MSRAIAITNTTSRRIGLSLITHCRLSTESNNVVKGSGLRRIQNKDRINTVTPLTREPTEAGGTTLNVDPHAIANEMIFSSTGSADSRPPGTEAIATYLTKEQKMSNYAMASGLLAFVSYIFYYSMASVGGSENAKQVFTGNKSKDVDSIPSDGTSTSPGFQEFLKEANEGMIEEANRMEKERKAKGEGKELAEQENAAAARLKAEGIEDVIVAPSANEEEELEMVRRAEFEEGASNETGRRPLWKRLVFFWRSE